MIKLAILVGLLAPQISGHARLQPASPFIGKGVEGGDGRSCNADLRVYPKMLDYDTTYRDCKHTPYSTLEKVEGRHYVLRLKPRSSACKVQVIIIDKSPDMEGWDVTSYSTEAAWRKRDGLNAVECILY